MKVLPGCVTVGTTGETYSHLTAGMLCRSADVTIEMLRRHIAATLPQCKVSAWLQSRGLRIHKPNAPVAQGTEQRTSNPPVAGSNPAGRASKSTRFAGKLTLACASVVRCP